MACIFHARRMFSIKARGDIYSWGDSYHTILGHGSDWHYLKPQKITLTTRVPSDHPNAQFTKPWLRRNTQNLTSKFLKIATGPFHTAAISEDYNLYTFGENKYGQLGHNRDFNYASKVPSLVGRRIIDAACGRDFTLALSDTGRVYSWGFGGEYKSFFQTIFTETLTSALGHGDGFNYVIPTMIESIWDISAVQAGNSHSLALTNNGEVYVWGDNEQGQLGISDSRAILPTKVEGLPYITQISAAGNASAALGINGDLYVWGDNLQGQLGKVEKTIKTPSKIGTGIRKVELGEGSLIAMTDTRILVAGMDIYSELTEMECDGVITSICAGDDWVAALTNSGKIWHTGGLFYEESPHSLLYLKRESKMRVADSDLFSGRVIELYGKYSYHIALAN